MKTCNNMANFSKWFVRDPFCYLNRINIIPGSNKQSSSIGATGKEFKKKIKKLYP